MDRILTLTELLSELDKYTYKEIHVHHTWKPTHKSFNGTNYLAIQQGMRENHINVNGWIDIGQHITLFPDGKFVTGRDFGITPASIQGYNTGAFACEMIGNFDVPWLPTTLANDLGYDKLQGAQLDSMLGLAKYFYDKGRYIRFHRENSDKTCPGNGIDKDVFMTQVKNYGTSKKYYVVTNYIPAGQYGIELFDVINRYFKDLQRIYMKSNATGMWIETQYLPKESAYALGDVLKNDNLLWSVVEE